MIHQEGRMANELTTVQRAQLGQLIKEVADLGQQVGGRTLDMTTAQRRFNDTWKHLPADSRYALRDHVAEMLARMSAVAEAFKQEFVSISLDDRNLPE
jgi:hypothetical protein